MEIDILLTIDGAEDVNAVHAKSAARVVRLLDRYGQEWFLALLHVWMPELISWLHPQNVLAWLATGLVPLSQALSSRDAGKAPARQITAALRQWTREQIDTLGRKTSALELEDEPAPLADPIVALLEAALVSGEKNVHRELLEYLGEDSADRMPLRLAVLQAATCRRDKDLLRRLGLAPIHARTQRILSGQMAIPPRAPGDWSIESPLTCNCRLCKIFGRYLVSKIQVKLEWPLLQRDRSPIEQAIDRWNLPVRHKVLPKGQPRIWELQKAPDLFEREAAERRACEKTLEWLREIAPKR